MNDDFDLDCLWVVYDCPQGFPDRYVVQMYLFDDAGNLYPRPFASVCRSLTEARAEIPAGAICVEREEGDDPTIVETWV